MKTAHLKHCFEMTALPEGFDDLLKAHLLLLYALWSTWTKVSLIAWFCLTLCSIWSTIFINILNIIKGAMQILYIIAITIIIIVIVSLL